MERMEIVLTEKVDWPEKSQLRVGWDPGKRTFFADITDMCREDLCYTAPHTRDQCQDTPVPSYGREAGELPTLEALEQALGQPWASWLDEDAKRRLTEAQQQAI